MTRTIVAGDTDLFLPLPPPGTRIDPYTVHTHYFGFTIPEEEIGGFLYARYMPAFGLSQGGPTVYRGMDNLSPLDAEFHDFRATMPWPAVTGNRIRFANGYEIDFEEPGQRVRLRYRSPDGRMALELEQRAVSPLVARSHIVPGEDDHHDATSGGSEQFMHCTGELELGPRRYAVDCIAIRDRSWNQVRTEEPGGARPSPPVAWSPAYFGDSLAFNLASIESPGSNPPWLDVFDVPMNAETSYFRWLIVDGELTPITEVRRAVTARHPALHCATRQELAFTDAQGREHRFEGRALAVAPVYTWPNMAAVDCVYRWTELQSGGTAHCTYQEIWWDTFHRRMKSSRALSLGGRR